MVRKLRLNLQLYAVFSVILVALSACGRNFFSAEREPWRREAEVACLKSGSVKESPERVRITPIEGPGMCGADFPLKISALGESRVLSYSDDPRPPGAIPGAGPRWPISDQRSTPAYSPGLPAAYEPAPPASYDSSSGSYPPVRAAAPQQAAPLKIAPAQTIPATGRYGRPAASLPPGTRRPSVFDKPESLPQEDEDEDRIAAPGPMERERPDYPAGQQAYPPARGAYPPAQPVPLGTQHLATASIAPVEVKPAATLACPIVSALDRWMMDSVQPASLRWFGEPVVEIKQISAYSCRGMNGQANARISEHAFGNALDIAAFILADGRKVTVKDGWRGTPEEQAFLHDVQGAACQQFTTVLAPGSNVFHYDHIHVDLMRRASGRVICQPGAIPGDVVAARARANGSYARHGDRMVTGSIAKSTKTAAKKKTGKWPPLEEEDEGVMEEPGRGGPGED